MKHAMARDAKQAGAAKLDQAIDHNLKEFGHGA